MRKPISARTIGAGLVGGHALLATAELAAIICTPRTPLDPYLLGALLGISAGQAGLVGLWSGLAKTSIAVRLAGAVVAGALVDGALFAALRAVVGDFDDWILAAVFALGPLGAGGVLGATLKWRGFNIEQYAAMDWACDRRRVQFSLSYLFIATLAFAVLLALVRSFRENPFEYLLLAAFNAVVFVMHTHICAWFALGTARQLVRLGALIVSTAFAARVYGFATGDYRVESQIFGEMLVVYTTLAVGSLLVLRRFGYRLTRQTPANGERGALAG